MNYFISDGEVTYSRALLFTWELMSNPTSFLETNGQFFIKKLEKFLDITNSPLAVINCNHIIDIDDHALKAIHDFAIEKKVNLIFYSSDNNHLFCNSLQEYFDNKEANTEIRSISDIGKFFLIKQGSSLNNECLTTLKSRVESIENRELIKLIGSSYVKAEDNFRLTSTPLKASGHFNANVINSDPSSFRWVISLMAEKIQHEISKVRYEDYTIVASSMRGAAIAASVREVLQYRDNINFQLLDHFGPKHDLRNSPFKLGMSEKEKCIYVGDFFIGGTEVKLSQTYCRGLGGELLKVFVLGKYTNNTNLGNSIQVNSLVQLSDCVDELKYELI